MKLIKFSIGILISISIIISISCDNETTLSINQEDTDTLITDTEVIDTTVEFSTMFNIATKDNVVFFQNDILDYHEDPIILTEKDKYGNSTIIDSSLYTIKTLDFSTVGKTNIVIKYNNKEIVSKVEISDNYITYENTVDGLSITNFSRFEEEMIIPRAIKGVKVTKLDWPSFYNNKTIKKVSLPDTLVEIGTVFEGSTLESLIIPDSVTKISAGAFAGSSLKSVTLSKSLNTIPWGTFDNCNLESITIPDSIEEIELNAFINNNIKTINWGTGLKKIGSNSFSNNEIEELIFPNNVTEVKNGAFSFNSLKKVIIDDSLEFIGEGAFLLSNNNVDVIIPESLNTSIELERIFGTEPLTVNNVSIEIAFDADDISAFSSWLTEKRLESPDSVIYESIITNNYNLSYEKLYNDGSEESYIVTKEGDVYGFSEYINDLLTKPITYGPNILSVLP